MEVLKLEKIRKGSDINARKSEKKGKDTDMNDLKLAKKRKDQSTGARKSEKKGKIQTWMP